MQTEIFHPNISILYKQYMCTCMYILLAQVSWQAKICRVWALDDQRDDLEKFYYFDLFMSQKQRQVMSCISHGIRNDTVTFTFSSSSLYGFCMMEQCIFVRILWLYLQIPASNNIGILRFRPSVLERVSSSPSTTALCKRGFGSVANCLHLVKMTSLHCIWEYLFQASPLEQLYPNIHGTRIALLRQVIPFPLKLFQEFFSQCSTIVVH